MKTDHKILVAFILNLSFSVFEFLGGFFTGSIAIISDAVHDMGDAFSIGAAYFLEKISKKQPNDQYTYGYARYSALGGVITDLVLILGSAAVVYNAVNRLIHPTQIHYNGMIILAVVGVCVNFAAAYFTREGDTLNQKAVNLHMLEDMLGWLAVLVGAVVMRLTDCSIIDPLLSMAVAMFVLVHAVRNLKQILSLFLEKSPEGVDLREIKGHLLELDGVVDVHHVHIWSLDGMNHCATMHLVVNKDDCAIKERARKVLQTQGIRHATFELESEGEHCHEPVCVAGHLAATCHVHHH